MLLRPKVPGRPSRTTTRFRFDSDTCQGSLACVMKDMLTLTSIEPHSRRPRLSPDGNGLPSPRLSKRRSSVWELNRSSKSGVENSKNHRLIYPTPA